MTSPHKSACTRSRERGFTLLEMLVAIVVLGILAAIAIPAYIQHRKTAYDASVKSDLRHMAEAQESWITETGFYSGTRNRPSLLSHGAAFSPDAVIQIGRVSGGYCLRGHHPDGKADGASGGGYYWYDSGAGGMSAQRALTPAGPGTCAAIPVDGWEDLDNGPDPMVPTGPVTPTPPVTPPVVPVGPTPPANDTCGGAIRLGGVLSTVDEVVSPVVDPALATADEHGAASLYFSHDTIMSAYETIEVRDPSDGGSSLSGVRTLLVFRGECDGTIGLLNTTLVGLSTGTYPGVTFRTMPNTTYYYVVVGALGRYEVAIERSDVAAVSNDFSAATTIEAAQNQTTAQDLGFSTLFADLEPLELPLMSSTVWHRVNTASGLNLLSAPNYTFTTRAPTNGKRPIGEHTIEVFSVPVSAGVPGVLVASQTGTLPLSVNFQGAVLGQSVMVRVRSATGVISGDYRVTLARGSA